ncbi:MAG TPA: helix-turn-helix domain-containing protein [Syntrophorhabdus sp.]|nr:helix-turn-helix domain-containing protein [Syntrophorhabdus sp.]
MENAVRQLLTIDELANRLKVKRSWLYSRTREKGDGTIPKIMVGKYVRFDEAAVLEWLKGKQDAD